MAKSSLAGDSYHEFGYAALCECAALRMRVFDDAGKCHESSTRLWGRRKAAHAARSRAGQPKTHQRPLPSWLHQQCNVPASSATGDHETLSPELEPELGRLPLDYGLLQLPSHVEPRVIHDALPCTYVCWPAPTTGHLINRVSLPNGAGKNLPERGMQCTGHT